MRVETPDLAAAVRDKKVDAVFTSAAQGVDTEMWRHLPYFYTAGAWLPRNLVLVQKKTFEALDPAVRETVMKMAAAAEIRGQKLSEENSRSMVEQLRSSGEKVDGLSASVRRQLDRAGTKIVKEVVDKEKSPDLMLMLVKYYSDTQ